MLFAAAVPPAPASAQVSIGVSVNFGPPAIPVYVQPPCPQPNLIWTPGYWQYGPAGYFWVPGAWVPAPYPGYLWTPGYWGYAGGAYGWHPGYWGRHVGFYGGVNYGFGFFGVGFVGGAWAGNVFRYNTAVVNVNRTVIRNVYINKTVINNNYYTRTRTSYYGGPGGITRPPLAAETAYAHETHIPPTPVQRQHVTVARQNRSFLATVNHGRPATAAVARPLSAANRPSDFTPVRPADKVRPAAAAPGAPAPAGDHPYRATHPDYAAKHPLPAHQAPVPPHQPGGGGHKVHNPPPAEHPDRPAAHPDRPAAHPEKPPRA
jgi:hypothetical protein